MTATTYARPLTRHSSFLPKPSRQPSAACSRAAAKSLPRRLRTLLAAEIDFVADESFQDSDAEARFCPQTETVGWAASDNRLADLPGHLARLCEARLLTPGEETCLFRRMNFLKFQADTIRKGLDLDRPDPRAVEQAEACLREAQMIRDRLVTSNLRLAMSVVKKFVSPQNSYDEVLSDGIYSLMQAVDKFDCGRGVRFSTYAYRAIVQNAVRKINERRRDVVQRAADGSALDVPDERGSSILHDEVWKHRRGLLTDLVGRLDRREKFIIRSRYALGAHRQVRSFQYLADKLGVSKERVRQLEQRAVSKLRGLAERHPLEELAGPALV